MSESTKFKVGEEVVCIERFNSFPLIAGGMYVVLDEVLHGGKPTIAVRPSQSTEPYSGYEWRKAFFFSRRFRHLTPQEKAIERLRESAGSAE